MLHGGEKAYRYKARMLLLIAVADGKCMRLLLSVACLPPKISGKGFPLQGFGSNPSSVPFFGFVSQTLPSQLQNSERSSIYLYTIPSIV